MKTVYSAVLALSSVAGTYAAPLKEQTGKAAVEARHDGFEYPALPLNYPHAPHPDGEEDPEESVEFPAELFDHSFSATHNAGSSSSSAEAPEVTAVPFNPFVPTFTASVSPTIHVGVSASAHTGEPTVPSVDFPSHGIPTEIPGAGFGGVSHSIPSYIPSEVPIASAEEPVHGSHASIPTEIPSAGFEGPSHSLPTYILSEMPTASAEEPVHGSHAGVPTGIPTEAPGAGFEGFPYDLSLSLPTERPTEVPTVTIAHVSQEISVSTHGEVSAAPHSENPHPENPHSGIPHSENPHSGIPHSENSHGLASGIPTSIPTGVHTPSVAGSPSLPLSIPTGYPTGFPHFGFPFTHEMPHGFPTSRPAGVPNFPFVFPQGAPFTARPSEVPTAAVADASHEAPSSISTPIPSIQFVPPHFGPPDESVSGSASAPASVEAGISVSAGHSHPTGEVAGEVPSVTPAAFGFPQISVPTTVPGASVEVPTEFPSHYSGKSIELPSLEVAAVPIKTPEPSVTAAVFGFPQISLPAAPSEHVTVAPEAPSAVASAHVSEPANAHVSASHSIAAAAAIATVLPSSVQSAAPEITKPVGAPAGFGPIMVLSTLNLGIPTGGFAPAALPMPTPVRVGPSPVITIRPPIRPTTSVNAPAKRAVVNKDQVISKLEDLVHNVKLHTSIISSWLTFLSA
jgi:hypothetical protein